MNPWFKLNDPDHVATPSLLVYPERISYNIQEMIKVAGDVNRLRPHIKTHKSPQIIALQREAGINKFKCATIAEAEMLANCEVPDILIAFPLAGPNTLRFIKLMTSYPQTEFSALTDNVSSVDQLDKLGREHGVVISLYIDIDVGMHRTGISPGPDALEVFAKIKEAECLEFQGWHVYDGHQRQSDFRERQKAVEDAFIPFLKMLEGIGNQQVVAGGSPTFPVHALRKGVDLSPGTTLLWDYGYGQMFKDLNFVPAAVVMTRVISKPAGDLLCLDLGHKAVASEMPHPRVHLLDLEVVEFTTHSEEHLVVRSADAPKYQVGDVLYGIPMHICPTSALHQEMVVIDFGEVIDRWPVVARDRRLEV